MFFVPRQAAFVLMAIVATAAGACASSTTAPPAVGDTCLVGAWVLTVETSQSGYAYQDKPVPVSGLAGTRLTITNAGHEDEIFEGSKPLVGTLPDGSQLVITIGGSFDYTIHAGGGKYSEKGATVQLPTTATVGGSSTPYQSHYEPGTGTYTCSNGSLVMTTSDGGQVDQWSKG